MHQNEENKMKMHLLLALQALYGIRCKYDEYDNKNELIEDLNIFIEFCDYHELFDYDIRLKTMLIMLVEKENLIQWLKERLTNE